MNKLKIGELIFSYTGNALKMALSGKELSTMHFAEVPTTPEALFETMDWMLNKKFLGAEKIEVTVKKGEPYSPSSIFEMGRIKEVAFKKAEDGCWIEYSHNGRKCQLCPRKDENGHWQVSAHGDWGHVRYLRYDSAREMIQLISGSSRAGTVGLRAEWKIGEEPARWDLNFDGHLCFGSHEYVAFVRFIREVVVPV